MLSGILMIIGTTIGGGMLALPLATGQLGFFYSSILLCLCWLVMTTSALLILEINLWLPEKANVISMARITLGKPGEFIAWITYLLLLYSLLSAYMAGGSDFVRQLISLLHIHVSNWLSLLLFTFILAIIVCRGILSVVSVNRNLMFAKLSIFFILVIALLAFIAPHQLSGGEFKYLTTGVTVTITAFGFANIIPSLRVFFNNDVRQLRKAILWGSLIPLVCYILWDLVIMGIIPRIGPHSLAQMLHANTSTGSFIYTIGILINNTWVTTVAHIFTAICLATSFLGVAISLSDFLADGLHISKESKKGWIVHVATFLPPLLIVLIYPGAFIAALSYAGIYCAILWIFLPAVMAWRGRYHQQFTRSYQFMGGKISLTLLIIAAIIIVCAGFYY